MGAGQGPGQCAFAVAPRDFFDDHGAAAAAGHPPHGVQEAGTPKKNRHSACRIAVRTYHFVGLFSQSDGFVLRECQTPYVHLDGNAEARCVPRCKQVLRRGGVGQSGRTHFILDRQLTLTE
jgi:hypothetical protein